MPLFRLCNICNRELEYGNKCKCEIDKEKERYKEYAKHRQDKDVQAIYSDKT